MTAFVLRYYCPATVTTVVSGLYDLTTGRVIGDTEQISLPCGYVSIRHGWCPRCGSHLRADVHCDEE